MMDGVFPMFFSDKLRNAPQRSRAKQSNALPSWLRHARRRESGLSGGWGTTLLYVQAQRLYVPGNVLSWDT